MEAVKEKADPVQTAVMVVYDHDLTQSKRHSGGVNYQCFFEDPWARNIRAYAFFRQHVQLLQACDEPKIVMAVGTFGEYRERIVGSWAALGVAEDSLLICAKYIRRSVAKFQGKNEHIALLLQEHYRRHPNIIITQVYLLDDDPINIKNCGTYSLFIQNKPWNVDPRLVVPVEGILVPAPELIMKPGKSVFVPSQEVETHLDKCLKLKVDTESSRTEWQFLQALTMLENKLRIEANPAHVQRLKYRNVSKKGPSKTSAARRLACSFDDSGFLNRRAEPLIEIGNLNQGGDAWDNSKSQSNAVSEDDGAENIREDEIQLLFRSV